jgi:hypothetical protein
MPFVSKSGSLSLLENSKPEEASTGIKFANKEANAARCKYGLSEGRGSLFIIKIVSSSYIVRMLPSSGRFRYSLNFFTHKTAFEYF